MTVCDRCNEPVRASAADRTEVNVMVPSSRSEIAAHDLCGSCRKDLIEAVRATVKALMANPPEKGKA